MLILLALLIITLIGLAVCLNDPYGSWGFAGTMVLAFGGAALLVALIGLPFQRLDVRNGIVEFRSIASTLAAARSRGESLENAAFQVKIAESNQWLASQQFYNHTAFDIWIPDAIDSLRPIR